MDKNKHKLYMAQILSLIFKDKDLCNVIAFKGGTSLMFLHNLNIKPCRCQYSCRLFQKL